MEKINPPTPVTAPVLPFSEALLLEAVCGRAVLDYRSIPNEAAPHLRNLLLDLRREATEGFDRLLNELNAEFKARIEASGGSIPTPDGAIEAENNYTPYAYDIDGLREAQKHLPAEEAKKLIKHVPAQIIPARDEPGHINSINALAKKYKGSIVATLITKAVTRHQTGVTLKWPKRKSESVAAPTELEEAS